MTAGSLTSEHEKMLIAAAISVEVAEAAGVRSAVTVEDVPEPFRWCKAAPGIVFPWRSPSGALLEQYRPDTPVMNGDGRARKYLFPKDSTPVLNVHPAMVDRLASTCPVVVVEGTKQYLAAVTAAIGTEHAVVGISGCWGWSSGGAPIADMAAISWVGRDVVIIFDADVATNCSVHQAAGRLADELELRGAASVKHAALPGGDNQGLDDVLAGRAVDGSTTVVFERLVAKAGRLPKKPKPPVEAGNPYFGPEGLMVAKLVTEVRARLHLAVDPGERLMVYDAGRYTDGRAAVRATIGELLGDMYRAMHERSAVELLVAHLVMAGRVIEASSNTSLVNVANGMLDPFTGELHPHGPEHLSTVQLTVAWDPDATCPTFNAWLDEVTAGRCDDLLEAVALMLDLRGMRQRKAVFLHGPTRSGKSTSIRLFEALVGNEARSAVTLHDLAGNRFAAADLFGKVLNTANELSAAHVDDLATFKAVTGDDPVRAERKYGQPFTFRNRALFIFAANEIPTVGEVSGAYLARIRPFRFPYSYEGREDPTIEAQMLTELPGILVRLVEALRRFEARGGYLDDDASRDALADFARQSDRVRLFLHETTIRGEDCFIARTTLFETFERWCTVNHRRPVGRHRFFEHVATAGYRAAKRRGDRGFVGLDTLPESDWGGPDPAEPAPRGQMGQLSHTPASRDDFEEKKKQEGVVSRGCGEAAPSAPRLADDEEAF